MIGCLPPDPAQAVSERLAGYIDCHAQLLGQSGFSGMWQDGLAPALLASCLTIYTALIGYRLLLGESYGPREAFIAIVRAGVVVAFTSGWPAYETVAYRVAIDAPSQVATALLHDSGGALSLTDAAQRLDSDFAALRSTAPGSLVAQGYTAPIQAGEPGPAPASATGLLSAQEGDPALHPSGWVLILSVLGGPALARLATGLILAIGPIFVVAALFDVTLGLFEGWVRALIGAFVASVGTAVATALELNFLEAQLAQPGPDLTNPAMLGDPALLVIAWTFCLVVAGILAIAILVGGGFRMPAAWRRRLVEPAWRLSAGSQSMQPRPAPSIVRAEAPGSRAQSVADAVVRLGRRGTAGFASVPAVAERSAERHLLLRRWSPTERGARAEAGDSGRRLARPQTASAERRESRS